jgi:hypothetical protein
LLIVIIRFLILLIKGSTIAWAIVGPIILSLGWVKSEVHSYDGVRGWVLWLGVAIMTSESIVQLVFTAPMIYHGFIELIKRFSSLTKPRELTKIEEQGVIPTWW